MNNRVLVLAVLILIGIFIIPVAAYTDGAYNLKLQSISPGWTYRSTISNNTLYQQEGFAIKIYDLANETPSSHSVKMMSFIDGNGGNNDLYATNGRLYLVGGSQLRIYDILSDRLNPIFLGNATITSASSLSIDGTLAYVGGGGYITTVDISDPEIPRILGQAAASYTGNLVTGDGYAYGTSGSSFGIYSIDGLGGAEYQSSKTSLGASSAYDIEYYNDTVYIANFKTNLQAWDVSNKTDAKLLWYSENSTPSYSPTKAVGVEIIDNYLYVSHRYGWDKAINSDIGGLSIWNITNHTPVLVGKCAGPTSLGYTEKLSTDGHFAVVHQGKIGSYLYNVTNVTSPVRLVHYAVPGQLEQMRVSQIGNMLVLGTSTYDGGPFYYNVTDPLNLNSPDEPVSMYSLKPTARMPFGTPLSGNYSYVHGGSNGDYGIVVNLTGIDEPGFPSDTTGYQYQNDNQIEYDFATPEYPNFLWTNHRWAEPVSINPATGVIVANGSAGSLYLGNGYQRVWNTTDKEHFRLVNSSNPGTPWGEMYTYNNTVDDKIQILQIALNRPSKGKVSIIVYDPNLVSGNLTKSFDNNFSMGYEPDGNEHAYIYDDTSKHAFVYTGNHLIHAINCSDPYNMYLEPGTVYVYMTGQSMASNGTDVFLGGLAAGNDYDDPSIVMVSFANFLHPRKIDQIRNYGAWSPALFFYNGYLYAGGGGSTEIIKVIPGTTYLPASPVVQWNATPMSGAYPLTVQFTDSSYDTSEDAGTIEYNWSFGDGTLSTLKNPKHTYLTEGTFAISLTILGAEAYNTSETQYITATGVKSDFYADVTYNQTPPLTVNFTSLARNDESWEWDFNNDGTVDATTRNATYQYTESGVYTVNYTVTGEGVSDSKIRTGYIIVGGGECEQSMGVYGLKAAYMKDYYPYNKTFHDTRNSTWAGTVTSQNSSIGYTFSYIGNLESVVYSSIGEKYKANYRMGYTWNTSDLADYTISSGYIRIKTGVQTPTVFYRGNGLGEPNYSVMSAYPADPLSWIGGDFNNFGTEVTSRVPWSDFVPDGRYVNFTLTNLSVVNKTYTTVIFMDSWNIDDDFTGTWASSTYSYVRILPLTATGKLPTTSTSAPMLFLNTTTTCNPSLLAPNAAIAASTQYGAVPLTVKFADVSQYNPTSWNWSFGDGNYSESQYPEHIYESIGEYNVSMTATNAVGNETAYVDISVQAEPASDTPPVAAFSCTPLTGLPPLFVSCMDESPNIPTSWSWDFGDGNTSVLQHPNNTYSGTGLKTISLNVTNDGGSDAITKTNYINVTYSGVIAPVAAFSCTPLSGNIPLSVTCTDESTNNPTTWQWLFSIGESGDPDYNQNSTIDFNSFGVRNVSLTVSNDAGSDDEVKIGYITVTNNTPTASFTASKTTVRVPGYVAFTDTSENNPSVWNWSFGDATFNETQNPVKLYTKRGIYNVTVNASNDGGYDIAYTTIRVIGYDSIENLGNGDWPYDSNIQIAGVVMAVLVGVLIYWRVKK